MIRICVVSINTHEWVKCLTSIWVITEREKNARGCVKAKAEKKSESKRKTHALFVQQALPRLEVSVGPMRSGQRKVHARKEGGQKFGYIE